MQIFQQNRRNRVQELKDLEAGKGGGSGSRNYEEIIGRPLVSPRVLSDVENTREFFPPDIDFDMIDEAIETDSYVIQGLDRYLELMFKSGWRLKGANPNAVDYVKQRLSVIAEATQLPTETLFLEMAEDLISYGNAIVTKVRDPNFQFPAGIVANPMSTRGPVVGYFPINVGQMSVRRNRYGVIQRWRQEVGDDTRDYSPEDVVHIFYRRKKGESMGRTFLTQAISDVRALRQVEEQVLKLIYRNLFPFIHAQVGSEEIPASRKEIDDVHQAINSMELDGGLATSYRVKLHPVAVNQIIDAFNYLLYFEKRVFTALGVSEVLMGRAASASRASAENLSVEMRNRIQAFQRILAVGIDSFIIQEILIEGGFDPILNPNDDVDFVFNQIDIDEVVKQENHTIYLYEHNSITEDEMRYDLGREALDDSEREGLFLNRITLPSSAPSDIQKSGPSGADPKSKSPNKGQSDDKDSGKTKKKQSIQDSIVDAIRTSRDCKAFESQLIGIFRQHFKEFDEVDQNVWLKYLPKLTEASKEMTSTPIIIPVFESLFDLMRREIEDIRGAKQPRTVQQQGEAKQLGKEETIENGSNGSTGK